MIHDPRPRLTRRWVWVPVLAGGLVACQPSDPVEASPSKRPTTAGAQAHEDVSGANGNTAVTEPAAPVGPRDSSAAAACPRWDELDLEALPALPASSYQPVLEATWRTVWARHYDPTFGCVDWPARRIVYGDALAQIDDVERAYAKINAMLAELRVSHLLALPPYDATSERVIGNGRLPFRVRWLDDQVVVTDPAAFGSASGIPSGAALTSIGARDLQALVQRLVTTPSAGSSFGTIVLNAIDELLRCANGTRVTVGYLDPGANDRPATTSVACQRPPGRRIDFGHLTGLAAHVQSRVLDGDIGYLTFNVWMLPVVGELRQQLTKLVARDVRALVLDLRGNPGGVGAMIIPVASMLVDAPTRLGKLAMRDFTQTLEARPTPGDPRYLGPVVVLVDEQTASTSEIFTSALRAHARVRVYGATPSAGMALPSLVERLPDGGLLQYAVGQYHGPDDERPEGKGVRPDVLVSTTRRDYIDGRDPVLDRALADLRQGAKLESKP